MKNSAAVYGVTAWFAMVIIICHVVYDWPVRALATYSMTWIVIALPLFIAGDAICGLVRWARARGEG